MTIATRLRCKFASNLGDVDFFVVDNNKIKKVRLSVCKIYGILFCRVPIRKGHLFGYAIICDVPNNSRRNIYIVVCIPFLIVLSQTVVLRLLSVLSF